MKWFDTLLSWSLYQTLKRGSFKVLLFHLINEGPGFMIQTNIALTAIATIVRSPIARCCRF